MPEIGGQPVLEGQRRAYENIRGKDRHKHMEAWDNDEHIHDFDDGYYIAEIRTQKDLLQEGKLQGHCSGGAGHVKSVEGRVAYFFGLRDKKGVPHATLHVRVVDKLGSPDGGGYTIYDGTRAFGVRQYSDSRAAVTDDNLPFMWDGKLCVALSISGRGLWGASTEKAANYKGMCQGWIESMREQAPVHMGEAVQVA